MKVALVFPPQGHFTQPYLSLPSLAAYLRANSKHEVTLFDANIEAYDHFLSKERLGRSLEKLRASEELAKLDTQDTLNFSDMERYQLLSEMNLIGEDLVAGIEEAKRVIRTPESFYDYERYLWAGRTIEQGLRLFSAEYAPTKLTPHGFMMENRLEFSGEIIAALDDEAHNPYIEYFRDEFLPKLKELDPDVVGISVTFAAQAIPGFTLAKLIKEWKPECHVTMGGGLLAYLSNKMTDMPAIWQAIDSMVVLEGERALLQLCETLDNGGDLAEVANLVWRDDAGKVHANKLQNPLDISTLPTPDFDGLPFELYFSPELVLPLASTRGCYWGKCVFCTLYTVIGPGYRGRSVEQTVKDIAFLKEKYQTKHFYMVIEDLPPEHAKALPRAILDANLDIDWWCDARLEHKVFTQEVCNDLAVSGCKRIAFGYESASKRVLDIMCKGIDPDASMDLVHRVHKAGISTTLYVMIGFPTETREEAELTMRTILANQEAIQEVSVRVFYLDKESEIYRRRAEFDITDVHPMEGADLQVYYDFTPGTGMTRHEARQVYLEFTRSLRDDFPVFQDTNMLYHELKSHYFLFLSKYGSWQALLEGVLNRKKAPSQLAALPARAAGLRMHEHRFDRSQIDERVSGMDSATLRARYQSDLILEEDRTRFDAEMEPELPQPSTLVYDSRTGEVRCFSPAAAELLERCDGQRTVEQIVELIPKEAWPAAEECLVQLADEGLLETQTKEFQS